MVAAGFGARRGGDEEVTEKAGAPTRWKHEAVRGRGCESERDERPRNTALHYAALNGSARGVEFLAASGAALDVKKQAGQDAARPRQRKRPAAAALRTSQHSCNELSATKARPGHASAARPLSYPLGLLSYFDRRRDVIRPSTL
jgi:hypothetical protein